MKLKVCFISSSVFKIPIFGYGGLESIVYEQAKGLAQKGHEVAIVAPEGSEFPYGEMISCGPAGKWDERKGYSTYWHRLPEFQVVCDHSVVGDANLLVRIDGKTKWISMENLYSWAEEKSPVFMDKGSCEIPVVGLEVPSAIDEFRIEWKSVHAVIRHTRKDPIHEVKTRGGNRVFVTSGHSVMVAADYGLEDVRADKCVGRFSATAKKLPSTDLDAQFWPLDIKDMKGCYVSGKEVSLIIQKDKYKLIREIEAEGLSYASAYARVSLWERNSVPLDKLSTIPKSFDIGRKKGGKIAWPVQLLDEDLILFGTWIGDGHYDKASVGLSSSFKDKELRASHVVAKRFGLSVMFGGTRPDVKHSINSTLLKSMMQAVGFVGYSTTKRFPDWIFGLSRRQIGLFLKGYFSADGSASANKVRLCSVNENLVRQVSVLLSICGINSRIACQTSFKEGSSYRNMGGINPMWELRIPKDDWSGFLKYVGFVQEDRNEKIRKGILTRRSRRGDVPFCLVRSANTGDDSRIISLSKLARFKGDVVADKFTKSHINWRIISESKVTNRQDKYVYDLSVPDTQNFFVGEMCCHNSWQKWSAMLQMEGKLHNSVLKWLHAPCNTMLQTIPTNLKYPGFVCISEDQKTHFEALFNSPARTCKNGVDENFYKEIPGIKRTDRYLFLARFSSIKGPDLAIDACLAANVGLDLVGDTSITNEPQCYEMCKQKAEQSNGKIRIVGPCSRGESVFWYSQAHCLLHLNQRFKEPLGLAPIEAMMAGTPCISWDYGAMKETVQNGITGFRVRSLEEAIDLIKTNAVASIDRKKCREYAVENFSLSRMVDRCESLCYETLENPW